MAKIKTRSSKRITQPSDPNQKTMNDVFQSMKDYIENAVGQNNGIISSTGSAKPEINSDHGSMFRRQAKSIDNLTGAVYSLKDSLSNFERVNQSNGSTIIKNTRETADNIEVVWEDQGKVLEGITNNNDLLKRGIIGIRQSLGNIDSSITSYFDRLNPSKLSKNVQLIANGSKFNRKNYSEEPDLSHMDDELSRIIKDMINSGELKVDKPDTPEKVKPDVKGSDRGLFAGFMKMFKVQSNKREDENRKKDRNFKKFMTRFVRDSIILNTAVKHGNKKLDAIKLGFLDLRTMLILNAVRSTISNILGFFKSPLGAMVFKFGAAYLIGKYIQEAASSLLDTVQANSPEFAKQFIADFRKTINSFFDKISFGNADTLEKIISGLIGLKLAKTIFKLSVKFVTKLFHMLTNGIRSIFNMKNLKALYESVKTGALKVAQKTVSGAEKIGSKLSSELKAGYDYVKNSKVVQGTKDLFKVGTEDAVEKDAGEKGLKAAMKVLVEKYGEKFAAKELIKTAVGGLETGSGVGAVVGAATLTSTIVDLTNMTKDLIKAYEGKSNQPPKSLQPQPDTTAQETNSYLRHLSENVLGSGVTDNSTTTTTQTQNNNYSVESGPINTGSSRTRLDSVEAAL